MYLSNKEVALCASCQNSELPYETNQYYQNVNHVLLRSPKIRLFTELSVEFIQYRVFHVEVCHFVFERKDLQKNLLKFKSPAKQFIQDVVGGQDWCPIDQGFPYDPSQGYGIIGQPQ